MLFSSQGKLFWLYIHGLAFYFFSVFVFCARFLCLVWSASPSMLLFALANSSIRRPAMNSRFKKSPIIWASERPLSTCKQKLCLFACSTSLPSLSRAVSTWYPHSRDQPNNASCCCQIKLRTYSAKQNYEPYRLILSGTTNSILFLHRFLIHNNVSLNAENQSSNFILFCAFHHAHKVQLCGKNCEHNGCFLSHRIWSNPRLRSLSMFPQL